MSDELIQAHADYILETWCSGTIHETEHLACAGYLCQAPERDEPEFGSIEFRCTACVIGLQAVIHNNPERGIQSSIVWHEGQDAIEVLSLVLAGLKDSDRVEALPRIVSEVVA